MPLLLPSARRLFVGFPAVVAAACLVVVCPGAQITLHPRNLVVTVGQPATFSVQATSPGTLSYQWRRNGIAIPGATLASYAIGSSRRADADWYEVVVSDGLTIETSRPARLSVAPMSYPGLVAHGVEDELLVERVDSPVNRFVAAAPDGRLYVSGELTSVDGRPCSGLVRLQADGTLDSGFNVPPGDLFLRGLVTLADGGVLLAGTLNWQETYPSWSLTRLRPDGSVDRSFDPDENGSCLALASLPDGKILVAGLFSSIGAQTRRGVARLNRDLTVDPTFDAQMGGATYYVMALARQADGRILLGGQFSTASGVARSNLARVHPNGQLDESFNATVTGRVVEKIAVQADGRVVIGGDFTAVNGQPRNRLARLEPDGQLDETFNPSPNSSLQSIQVLADGRIWITGDFNSIAGQARPYLAVFLPNGQLDPTFAATPDASVNSLVPWRDGKLALAGRFARINGVGVPGLGLIDANGALDGNFVPRLRFAGTINCMRELPDGRFIVAGRFSHLGGRLAAVPNLAIVRPDGIMDESFAPPGGPTDTVEQMAVQPDGLVLLAGRFNNFAGSGRTGIVRILPDGRVDTTFDAKSGTNGGMNLGDGPVILRGGRIALAMYASTWAGSPSFGMVMLNADGSRDALFDMGDGFGRGSPTVSTMAAQGDGRLLVGGDFVTYNGQAVGRIARLNPDGSLDSSFATGAGFDRTVRDIFVQADGRIVVAGIFSTYNGTSCGGVIRLEPDGRVDPTFGSLSGFSYGFYRSVLQENGALLVLGGFSNLLGLSNTQRLDRLTASGTVDGTFGVLSTVAPFQRAPAVLGGDGRLRVVVPRQGIVTLRDGEPPRITLQPVGRTAKYGSTVTLAAAASGIPAPTIQWYRDGIAVPGATEATLTITNLQLATAGSFVVVASNLLGTAQSARITVIATPDGPKIQTQPQSITVAGGAAASFSVTATGSALALNYQWKFNDRIIPGATNPTYHIGSVAIGNAGQYTVTVRDVYGEVTSRPAVLSVSIPGKLAGLATEVGPDIPHPNGNIYDQMLLNGASASVRADPGQVVRTSFVDLTDDIVQVEFAGAGTLTVTLEPGATGPAVPANYNQTVQYMRGHARIVVAGADETTNLSVFSVGRLTAFDPTGAFDPTKPFSATNDPARNGNPIFKVGTTYDGMADLASISIVSTNGKFGGLRTSNASYFATAGLTGVYAPGVEFTGPVFIGDLSAADAAQPVLLLGNAADVRITGGDLLQSNGAPVAISGITRLQFAAGVDSHGRALPAQANRARLEQDGVDVTVQVVTGGP